MVNLRNIEAVLSAAYKADEYPVCQWQTAEWSVSKPLLGLTVLDATPIFRNTMVKYKALMAAGARLIVGRATGFPCDDSIVRLLRESGITVVSSAEEQAEAVDVVLDCAASFSHWKARLGAVELTRSGVPKYEALGTTVFAADSGRIKRIETCLGTGESYFRAMKQLGYSDWKGRRVVVFGSGKVGTGLITYAQRNGAEVVVVSQPASVAESVSRMASQIIDCNDVAAVAEAVGEAFAVVSATGIAGALSHPTIVEALRQSPALLANMGVEDEYGAAMPAERVLNGKRTLNFLLEEPTHLKYIDATMGLHNEGIIYLITHPGERGIIEPPADLEEKLLGITRQKGCIGDEISMI